MTTGSSGKALLYGVVPYRNISIKNSATNMPFYLKMTGATFSHTIQSEKREPSLLMTDDVVANGAFVTLKAFTLLFKPLLHNMEKRPASFHLPKGFI